MASEYDTFNHLKYRIVVDDYGGTLYYNDNNQLHREEGPAVVDVGGINMWWKNGKRHREDGPAVIWADGTESYFLDGVSLSKKEFERWQAKNGR